MTEYYAIELWHFDKYNSHPYFRSDLYYSSKKAKAAFNDLDTKTLFQALEELQSHENPPVVFQGDYWEAEGIEQAYDEGIEEVVQAVKKLREAVVNESDEVSFGVHSPVITACVVSFTVHEN